MKQKIKPTFLEEKFLWENGYSSIAGIDEVGRGAFAGPLVTAAVIFPKNCSFIDRELHDINDSKVLTPKKRTILSEKIKNEALSFSISVIPVSYINRYGVGKAAQLGFFKSVTTLQKAADYCLIDAFYIKKLRKGIQKPIIHGDGLSISIAAASIIAKVYRDDLMVKLHISAERYRFDINKGYGTAFHREQIKNFGLSPYHRTSFNFSSCLST